MITEIILALTAIAAPEYQAYVLNTEASVWDVAAKDVTGDGKAELFVLCCDEKSYPLTKFVNVYLADSNAAYPTQASFRLDLAPSISTLFFAETDGKPPAELVAADAEGATIFRYEEGKLAAAASPRFPSLFPSGSKEPTFLKDVAVDLDGDGIDEWIIPVPEGYELRTPTTSLCRIACDMVSEIHPGETAYISHRLAAHLPFEIPGESNKALAFLSDEFADFAHGDGWAQHARYKIPVNVDDKWEASAKMTDINGDKLPDLVVTQTKGTINLQAVTHVYLASAPFTYPDAPTATFSANGAIAGASLVDVDGDGSKDMVFVSVPFGVRNIVNFFVRRKVSARVEVYLFKDGRFASKPTFSDSFLLDAPEGRERVAYTFGDFNGDGRLDAAFGSTANKMDIYVGTPDKLISAKPWMTLNLPTFGEARPCDLNGNASKDLVLYHPGGANKKRVDVVVF